MAAQSPVTTAAGLDRVWKFAGKTAWGYPFNYLKNVIEHTFAYTHITKKVSGATVGAVLSVTAGNGAQQVLTTGITNPDVPRVLAVTINGTSITSDSIVIKGTNVEGKPITDTLSYTGTGQVTGALVFKTVTSVTMQGTMPAANTVSVDTTNEIGLVHRVPPSKTTAIVIHDNILDRVTTGTTNLPVLEAAPTSSNFDNEFTEKNWVVPATAPNGTNFLYIFYWFHKVKIQPVKDSPDFYSTTTSTSTSSTSSSSSTSTSISSTSSSVSSTSISSTSSSTSISSTSSSSTSISSTSTSATNTTTSTSSSTSISSTSTSISSTSTSTTTLPF